MQKAAWAACIMTGTNKIDQATMLHGRLELVIIHLHYCNDGKNFETRNQQSRDRATSQKRIIVTKQFLN